MVSSKLSPLDKAFARRPTRAFLRRFDPSIGPFRRFPLVQGLVNVPACLPSDIIFDGRFTLSLSAAVEPPDLISLVEETLPGFVPSCTSIVYFTKVSSSSGNTVE